MKAPSGRLFLGGYSGLLVGRSLLVYWVLIVEVTVQPVVEVIIMDALCLDVLFW